VFVNFNILNQLGSPAINSNVFANRPAAGQTGRLFVSTDTFEIYRDNGTTWDLIGGPGSSTITGTGTATQVAYFTSSQAIGSSANLFWDNTNSFLGVATATPTATIEAVKTDGIGIFANYTTNAGTGSSATAIYAINNTASSGYAAVIEEKTGNTTGGQYPLLVKHSLSSGTAAVGMGTGVHWQLPDDAGTFKTTQLTIETIDAAAATYATRYRFMVQSAGSSTPAAYLNATGLGLGTATPGAKLDIHSTGTVAQFNTTSGTGNVFIALQRTGTGLWRIGDTYNSGANFFELHNTVLTNNAIEVLAASNEATFLSTKTYSTGNAIGIAVQHNLTIPNGVNVGLAAIGGVNSNLNLTLGGSTTVAATGRQGLEGSTSINFTGAGTLTMTQGSTVRAFSALSSVYAFNGSAVGTITHLAGLRICFPDNVGSAVNITNNYALLINNQTTGTGTVTYTNRWGIYQEGASDLNYFAANTLIGTTTNSGEKLVVNGSATFGGTNAKLLVDVTNQRIYTTTAGFSRGFYLNFNANNYFFGDAADLLGLNCDVNIGKYTLGDTQFVYNGTNLVVDDQSQIIYTQYNLNNLGLSLDFANNRYKLGDINNSCLLDINSFVTTLEGGNNGIQFILNDSNGIIKTAVSGADNGLFIDTVNNVYYLGSSNIFQQLYESGSSAYFSFYLPSIGDIQGLNIVYSNYTTGVLDQVQIGDIFGGGNSTRIIIDDVNSQIDINNKPNFSNVSVAGSAGALQGYFTMKINGTDRKIPYYAV